MLTYILEPHTPVPLYEQLIRRIKEDISSGILNPGEKLPSKRSLAGNLGISTVTVETTYQQLIAEGYITSAPRRGYFVSDISSILPKDGTPYTGEQSGEDSPQGQTAGEDAAPGAADAGDIRSPGLPPCSFDFSASSTSGENFPFTIWARLSREVLSGEPSRLLAPSPGTGIPALRAAIARHLYSFRGIKCSPEQIVVGAGTEYLYGLVIQLLGFDKIYGVEDPGYRKISKVYQSYGVACRYLPLSDFSKGAGLLQQTGVDVLHISPSHHFPTGRVMPIRERNQLLQWAAEGDRTIIEDDYDSEFRMVGQPIPSLFETDPYGHVIYMNTFTKTLASTVRISYMVLPEKLLQRFRDQLSFYSCTVSNVEQYTLSLFLTDGCFERHLNRMRNYYRAKRNRILKLLADSPLAARMKIREEDAGLHFLLELEMEMTDSCFTERCAAEHIRITPISVYYHVPETAPQHIYVINYSSLEEKLLPDAVEKIAEILKNERKLKKV